MSQRLVGQALDGTSARSGLESLTVREMQIFELIGQGLSTSEIAKRWTLSVHTIETHREKIRRKLQLRNGTALMLRAVQWRYSRAHDNENSSSLPDRWWNPDE